MLTDSPERDYGSRDVRILNLLDRRCLSPLSLYIRDGGEDDGAAIVHRVSYHKLPQQRLFKLSVLKLDGSLFDVHIARSATVGELKQAIVEIFTSLQEEVQGNISWSHVWGHFCLSYRGQKLINDKARVQNMGIKDGDQLEFSRHVSINHSPSRRRTKKLSVLPKRQLLLGSNTHQEKEQNAITRNDENQNAEDSSRYYSSKDGEDNQEIQVSAFKLSQVFRGLLPRRGVSEARNRPSRFALQCLGG